ncbi:MAG TPA: nuclear transport factor 2 family protein [Candidatus Limnocylindrales bacterium]|nr:nuclear transport factor 2 family protein [Candidatus Limnocylindrales bacterium]
MPNLTPGDGHDLLAALKAGYEARDPNAILELFDEDAEMRIDPFAEPLNGSLEIRRHWNNVCAEQAHVEFEPERTWVSGSAVLSSWHGAYTRRATGERVRARGFMVLELGEDRRIERLRGWPMERVVGMDGSFRPQTTEDADGR